MPIHGDILREPTDPRWFTQAGEYRDQLLIDHAHCEKKAARMALQMINAYPANNKLVRLMAQLAREELLHLRQVLDLMDARGLRLAPLSAPRYATQLHASLAKNEPDRCADLLICGALIEARSCERFAGLAESFAATDPQLARYYRFLVKAEGRHYANYLNLAAELLPPGKLAQRIERLARLESELVNAPAKALRMHSGPLQAA